MSGPDGIDERFGTLMGALAKVTGPARFSDNPHSLSLPAGTRAAFAPQRTLSPLPPSGSRYQNYAVDLTLRVSDLSGTTKQAINLTRGWGGYVVNVDSG